MFMPAQESPLAIPTVMIVDDMPEIRGVLRRVLEMQGYCVVAEASDGFEAVEMYSEWLPQITLMDICLPKKNGIEATRDIVSLDKDATVVMISALGSEAIARATREAGAKAFISKPCRLDHLKKILHQVMQQEQAA